MVAAVQAALSGARVTLVEREKELGGNARRSTGCLRGSETWLQEKLGIKDTVEQDFAEAWEHSGRAAEPTIVARMAANARSASKWLKGLGVKFMADKMAIPPRTALILPSGQGLTDRLCAHAKRLGVTFLLGTRAERLVMKRGKVVGAMVSAGGTEKRLQPFDAVVLTTGGAWGPPEFLRKLLDPSLHDVITSWGAATGGKSDGYRMGEEAGGLLVGAENLVINPELILDKDLNPIGTVTSSLRHAGGAIFLNQAFERFVNEDLTYSYLGAEVARELKRRGEKWIWEIWDSKCLDAVPISRTYKERYLDAIHEGASLEELARKAGIDPDSLERVVSEYNSYFEKGLENDPRFGRALGPAKPLATAPFYAVKIGLGCVHSLGGLKVNDEAQVLDASGKPIPNLFAAGDDIGGVHGRGHLTGASLRNVVVFGRIAGENAARGDLGAAARQQSSF